MAASADLEFLKKMDAEAKRLAKRVNSCDHWAKPFYSDVHLFKPGSRRAFIGINGKGNRYSLKYDKQQQNEQRTWSGNKPFHNAYLDECWGHEPSGPSSDKGQAPLQVAVKGVFEAMYGDDWKGRLRNTPCFNLIPVSSNGTTDKRLDEIWDDGVDWCINLVKYLMPKFIILYGNSPKPPKGRSVWFALANRFPLKESSSPIELKVANYSLLRGVIQGGLLDGVPVLGLPHLSMIKGKNLDKLVNKLKELRPFP